jgi:histone acetyltransferase (RNA polymerase elongator complex component)
VARHYTIPIFIPELACPFQCVFCNQEKITGKALIPDDAAIIATISDHLATFKAEERTVEIGFFGGSFTGIPIDRQIHYLDLVRPFLDNGSVDGIRLSTRPDYINREVLDMLKEKQVTAIELGAQSMSDEVLKASGRGHTAEQTEMAARLIQDHGFKPGLQMMIGLPEDTPGRSLFTAQRIVALQAITTRIYPTLVIRGTALHKRYTEGKYEPLSLEEAVNRTAAILPVFEKAGIKILRIGLHPSEGLLNGCELVAGPFHPSFRELVLTKLWRDILRASDIPQSGNSLNIFVNEKQLNYAIGYTSANRKMLLERFNKVSFKTDKTLTGRDFKYAIRQVSAGR